MSTQSRLPGAASSEVDFELERFERTGADRIEIAGRWFGLRGRRFVRPVLNLHTVGGSRRRAIALLEHKPWAADDGEPWVAAFAWPQGAGEVEGAVLEVGPGLIVDLPAPGGKHGSQGRVSALRPHAPAPMARRITPEDDELVADADRAPGTDDEGGGRRARGAPGGSSRTLRERSRGPAGGAIGASARSLGAADAPEFTFRERTPAPPRDLVTATMQERDEAVAARDEAERERVQALTDRDDALSRRDAALRDVDRAAAERDEAITERDRLAAELERVTRERDVADAERKRMMQDAETVARDRDQAAAERDAARSELSRALPERDHALREAESATARADRAESERDTAFAERKTAVAQRDRARRERDRAMRAAGIEPPTDTPFVRAQGSGEPAAGADQVASHDFGAPVENVRLVAPAAGVDRPAPHDGSAPVENVRLVAPAPGEIPPVSAADPVGAVPTNGAADAGPADLQPAGAQRPPEGAAAAAPPGTPLPSRPLKRIGTAPAGPAPEPKSLLTPVDSGRPRRLSRTRRPPSAPARWAVRILALLVLVAVVVVLAILLASLL